MNPPQPSAAQIESYLQRLRKRLRGLPEETIADIVGELRAHVVEKLVANEGAEPPAVEAVLADLGSPEELAGLYLTDDLLARAETSRSPLHLLAGLSRWASLSFVGFFLLVGALVAYLLAGALVVVAILKPFHPGTAGLWLDSSAGGDLHFVLQLGFEGAPAPGRELLGWWIVPIGLVLGYGLIRSTTGFVLRAARRARAARPPLSG